ncbi:MAG: MFS transporter [Thermomicrobiales bacterium]
MGEPSRRGFEIPGGWPLGSALAAVFLGAIDLTVISTVLPRMVTDLQINTADIDRYIWVVNAYLLAYIIAIPVVGRVSDLLGRGIAFQGALALFMAGSVWAGLSDNLGHLIVARAVQGAGGGALLPVTMALVGDLMPPGRRIATLGVVGAVDTLGWVLGPIWGALIVGILAASFEPWRWVFWINVPVSFVVSIVIARRIGFRRPASSADRSEGRLDVLGALLLGSSLLLLNLGLSSGGEVGVTAGSAMRALGGTRNPLATHLALLLSSGGALLILFILWQRKTRHPLLPLSLFRQRAFSAALAANFIAGAALIVAMVDIPVVVALLVDQDRISVVSAALLAPFTLVMAATSFTGGIIASRFGERRTAAVGLTMVFLGYAALWIGLRGDHYLRMIPGLILAGAGFGLAVAPIGASAIDSAPAKDRGIAAATTILFRLLGMTMSISALTAFGISRLQTLSEQVPSISRQPEESTAQFLVRQSDYIQNVAIPLSVRVVRDTFLLAGLIAALALIPVALMTARSSPPSEPDDPAPADAAIRQPMVSDS